MICMLSQVGDSFKMLTKKFEPVPVPLFPKDDASLGAPVPDRIPFFNQAQAQAGLFEERIEIRRFGRFTQDAGGFFGLRWNARFIFFAEVKSFAVSDIFCSGN